MPYKVRNNRSARPVTDTRTGIVLRGTVTVSDENMAKLRENPVIAAMLAFDKDGEPRGSELLSVEKLKEPEPKAKAEKPKKN